MSAIQNGNIIHIDCENCSWTCYVSDNASFKLNKYCGFGDGDISIIPTFNSDIIYGIVTFVFNRRPCQIVQELEITQNEALMPSFFSVTPKDIFFTNKNEEINVSVKTNMGTPNFENHNASDYSVAQIDSDGDNYIFTVKSINTSNFNNALIQFSTNNKEYIDNVWVSQYSDEIMAADDFSVSPLSVTLNKAHKQCRLSIVSIQNGEIQDFTYKSNKNGLNIIASSTYVDITLTDEPTQSKDWKITFTQSGSNKTSVVNVKWEYEAPQESYFYWVSGNTNPTEIEINFTTTNASSVIALTVDSSSKWNVLSKPNFIDASPSGGNKLLIRLIDKSPQLNGQMLTLRNSDNLTISCRVTVADGLIAESNYVFSLSADPNQTEVIGNIEIKQADTTFNRYILNSYHATNNGVRDYNVNWSLRSLNLVTYQLLRYSESRSTWSVVTKGTVGNNGQNIVWIGDNKGELPYEIHEGDYWIKSYGLGDIYGDSEVEGHCRLVQDECYNEIDITCIYPNQEQRYVEGIVISASTDMVNWTDNIEIPISGGTVYLQVMQKFSDDTYEIITSNVSWGIYDNSISYNQGHWEYVIPSNPYVQKNTIYLTASYQGYDDTCTIEQEGQSQSFNLTYNLYQYETNEYNVNETPTIISPNTANDEYDYEVTQVASYYMIAITIRDNNTGTILSKNDIKDVVVTVNETQQLDVWDVEINNITYTLLYKWEVELGTKLSEVYNVQISYNDQTVNFSLLQKNSYVFYGNDGDLKLSTNYKKLVPTSGDAVQVDVTMVYHDSNDPSLTYELSGQNNQCEFIEYFNSSAIRVPQMSEDKMIWTIQPNIAPSQVTQALKAKYKKSDGSYVESNLIQLKQDMVVVSQWVTTVRLYTETSYEIEENSNNFTIPSSGRYYFTIELTNIAYDTTIMSHESTVMVDGVQISATPDGRYYWDADTQKQTTYPVYITASTTADTSYNEELSYTVRARQTKITYEITNGTTNNNTFVAQVSLSGTSSNTPFIIDAISINEYVKGLGKTNPIVVKNINIRDDEKRFLQWKAKYQGAYQEGTEPKPQTAIFRVYFYDYDGNKLNGYGPLEFRDTSLTVSFLNEANGSLNSELDLQLVGEIRFSIEFTSY